MYISFSNMLVEEKEDTECDISYLICDVNDKKACKEDRNNSMALQTSAMR